MDDIRYLSGKDVDRSAWDAAVDRSPHGLPYAYSWYLDAATDGHWDALISEDYRYVFPLPYNRKLLGWKQVYRPPFWQQGGLFGKDVTPSLLPAWVNKIPASFRRLHLTLHAGCGPLPHFNPRTNLILSLDRPYEALRTDYGKSLRKRIRRARSSGLTVNSSDHLVEIFTLYRAEIGDRLSWSKQDYNRAFRTLEVALERDKAILRTVVDETGHFLGGGCFLVSHGRVVNVMGAVTEAGKQIFATHLLLDEVIQEYHQRARLFDFEGSEIPGVASFFRSFGATEEIYYDHFSSRLPSWLNALLALRAG